MNSLQEYRSLVAAIKILDEAQLELWKEESTSPAWRLVLDAYEHIRKQADAVLRDVQWDERTDERAELADSVLSLQKQLDGNELGNDIACTTSQQETNSERIRQRVSTT